MTMSKSEQENPGLERGKSFGIITIQGRVLDLSDFLKSRPRSDVSWTAHPKGPLHGLTATTDEHEASISWAPPPATLRETGAENVPDELTAYVRQTYLDYFDLCLRLGEFQLEATPVTDASDNITGSSLRVRLAERGAAWLGDLPATDQQRFARIPRSDEATMVDVPDTVPSQPASAGPTVPGEPT